MLRTRFAAIAFMAVAFFVFLCSAAAQRTPADFPLSQNPATQNLIPATFTNIAAPAAGEGVILADIPGYGIVKHVQFILGSTDDFAKMRLKVYVDNENTASIDDEIAVLMGFTSRGSGNDWGHVLWDVHTDPANHLGYANVRFLIPFGNHCRIVLYNAGSGAAGSLWSTVTYAAVPPGPYRQRSARTTSAAPLSIASGASPTLLNLPSGYGFLTWVTFAGVGASDNSWMERDVTFSANGTTNVHMTSGTEDFFGGAFFAGFNGSYRYFVTTDDVGHKANFAIDLLDEWNGGFGFKNGIQITYPTEGAVVTNATLAYSIGYLIDTSVHGTILPELDITKFPGATCIWDCGNGNRFQLRGHLTAPRSCLADNDPVGLLLDLSGHGNNMPTENDTHKPKWKIAGPNGYGYLTDASGDGFMHFPVSDLSLGDFSLVAVSRVKDTSSGAPTMMSGKNSIDYIGFQANGGHTANRAAMGRNGGSTEYQIAVDIPDSTNWHINEWNRVGSTLKFYQDGTLIGSVTADSSALQVGALDRLAGGTFTGNERVILAVIPGGLSSGQRSTLVSYLKARYSLL